jgi:hypothetical protein
MATSPQEQVSAAQARSATKYRSSHSVDASVNSCINETVQKIEEHVRTGSSARQSMASETQVACRLDPTYDKDSQAFQFELKLTPMVSSMGPPPLPGVSHKISSRDLDTKN